MKIKKSGSGRKTNGYLFKRGDVYWVCWTYQGKKHRQTTGATTERAAETEKARILAPYRQSGKVEVLAALHNRLDTERATLARIEETANPALAVADAWEAYLNAGNRKEIGELTLRNYESYWDTFTKWLAKKQPEVVALRDVSYQVAEEYKAHLLKRQVKGHTVTMTGRTFNAHRAFLMVLWSILADKARLTAVYQTPKNKDTKNPWEALAKRDEHSQGRRPLTIEELRNVCQSASGELRTLFALGLYLGARLGDCATLTWGGVDMVRGTMRYTPRKTARKVGEALLVPLHLVLFTMLAETPAQARKGYIMPGLAHRYLNEGQARVSILVQKHFEKCGLQTTVMREGAGQRKTVEVGFHSLRHTAISLLREAGAAQSVSQYLVGHNSAEVHAQYTHTSEHALRAAVDTLPSVAADALALPPAPVKMVEAAAVRALAELLTAENAVEIRTELLKLAT